MTSPAEKLRLDKWLWHARFFKTRSLAAHACKDRKIRIDGVVQSKASALVSPGQVLTFARGQQIFVVRILGLGVRRGPANEAQTLYEDLSPPPLPREALPPAVAQREPGSGRPTKAQRRAIDRLKDR